MRKPLSLLVIIVLAGACPLFADTTSEGWTLGVGCPGSGTSFVGGVFTGTTSGGFSSTGVCSRISTQFTQFNLSSYSGGTPNTTTLFGLHTGDVLILPPILNTETEPVFTVAPDCPYTNKSLNWIAVQWGGSPLGPVVMGTATYDTVAGLTVTSRYNYLGTLTSSATVPLPGSCTNGIYALSGSGDQGGNIYFTAIGAGDFKSAAGHAYFYFPQYSISAAQDLANVNVSGILFDSVAAADTRQLQVTSDGTGTQFMMKPYADPVAGVLDSSGTAFTDSISLTENSPLTGMMTGTVTRTGAGAGTGSVVCIAYRATFTRVICSGQSPINNANAYSVAFTVEGPQVLGQASSMSVSTLENGLYEPFVSGDGTRVFVADNANNRILIWNTVPTASGVPPNVFLGQIGMDSNTQNYGGLSSQSMKLPKSVASDGVHLFVSDTGNNRVLVWNSIPTTNQKAADFVLGQPNMTSSSANNGGINGASLSSPNVIYTDGTKLYVADQGNARVLVWNHLPTTNQAPADWVLGQPTLTSNTADNGGISAQSLATPNGVSSDGTHLFVYDGARALIWNSLPTTNQAAADLVLGQPSMTTRTGSGGCPSALCVSGASGTGSANIISIGNKVYATDPIWHRLLGWNSIPTANGQAADFVLGHTVMNSGTPMDPMGGGTGATWHYNPSSIYSDGTNLFTADTCNNTPRQFLDRVVIWNSLPSTNNAAADVAMGLPSLGSLDDGTSAQTLTSVNSISSDGTHLFVADSGASRVLIWNNMPSVSGQGANLVLGQASLTSFVIVNSCVPAGVSTKTLNVAASAFYDGSHFYVTDVGDNRVLIWNSLPTTNQQAANVMIGQSNTYGCTAATSATGLHSPVSAVSDGTHVLVADDANNRIQIWNQVPTTNNVAANTVLGQPDMTSKTANNGGLSAQTLSGPNGLYTDGTRLVAADSANNRVLIWNSLPSSNQQAADLVLGQPNMTAGTAATSSIRMSNPKYVYSDGTRLFVTDASNNRVLIWNSFPTTNQQAASAVLGQPNMTSKTANNGGLGPQSLSSPGGIYSDGTKVFVGDTGNSRIVVFDLP